MSKQNNVVFKNSFFLALRTIITMCIALYSSRVILKNLGVEDFGIYNIVGSVIAFWASLRGIFASSTQRFLNVGKATETIDNVRRIFSVSLFLHLVLAVLFLVTIGCIGGYILNFTLDIPDDRLFAANWVFGCSLLASFYSILSIPFDAAIIANEKMGFFALTSVFESVGKLIIALLIPFMGLDRLIFYGIGICGLTIIVRTLIILYSFIHFKEVNFNLSKDSGLLKRMGSFAGWNFLGNTTYHVVTEGGNMLLNVYWGPVLNASRGIAYQVMGAIGSFSSTVLTAANPQICRLSTDKDKSELESFFSLVVRSMFYLTLLLVFPILLNISSILLFWLGDIPEFTSDFVVILLLYVLLRSLHGPIDSLFLAYGNLRKYQLLEMLTLFSTIVISFIGVAFLSAPPHLIFLSLISVEFINQILIVLLAKSQMGFNVNRYVREDIFPIIRVLIISLVVNLLIYFFIINVHWTLSSLLSLILLVFVVFLFGYSNTEKKILILFIKTKFLKR